MSNEPFQTLEEMIVNLAIVTAFLFLTSQILFKKRSLGARLSFVVRIKIALLSGVLGILLMLFTVSFHDTILDFRQLAIILSALVGGFIPSLLTGVIIGTMRLVAFGPITSNSLIAAVNTTVICLGVGLICSRSLSYWKKWIYCLLVCNGLTCIAFFLIFGSNGLMPSLLYIVMLTSGGLFTAYLTLFLAKAKRYSLRMEKEATMDFLTDLNNHRTFDTAYNMILAHAIEKKEPLSLMLLDIDLFKKVNDTYGHPNGDCLLKQVGDLLKSMARNTDIVSRIGGEEFSILLLGCSHSEALGRAEKIRLAVQEHSFILNDETRIQITISIGVESLSAENENNLIEQADLALYKAKTNGRNRVYSHV
jgi:diguanylate cyclase